MFMQTWIPLALLLSVSQAQGLSVPSFASPTRTAAAPTPQEIATLREGIALYDQRKYDEAFAFQAIRVASDVAIYEMALVHFASVSTRDRSSRRARPTSPSRPRSAMADDRNTLDARARTARRLVYRESSCAGHFAVPLAVTQAQSLADAPAQVSLRRAGSSPVTPAHMLLGRLFAMDDLKTPAILALGRFLILSLAVMHVRAYQLWFLLNGANSAAGAARPNIVNPAQKKDEVT
jgi:hypothetical protein